MRVFSYYINAIYWFRFRYLHNPAQKEVIWVVGERGNEGKTFFQDQIEEQYGMHRDFSNET